MCLQTCFRNRVLNGPCEHSAENLGRVKLVLTILCLPRFLIDRELHRSVDLFAVQVAFHVDGDSLRRTGCFIGSGSGRFDVRYNAFPYDSRVHIVEVTSQDYSNILQRNVSAVKRWPHASLTSPLKLSTATSSIFSKRLTLSLKACSARVVVPKRARSISTLQAMSSGYSQT